MATCNTQSPWTIAPLVELNPLALVQMIEPIAGSMMPILGSWKTNECGGDGSPENTKGTRPSESIRGAFATVRTTLAMPTVVVESPAQTESARTCRVFDADHPL